MNGLRMMIVVALTLTGCTLGPDYQRPEMETPAAFRYAGENAAAWKIAEPADDTPKGEWWRLFADSRLNELQAQATAANQELRAALARLDQARAAARISEAAQAPTLDLNPAASRRRTPADLSGTGAAITADTITLPLDLAYEIDLWGRVRRSVEAAGADYQAAASDLETIRLGLHAEVARHYFTLRALDRESELLAATVELRRENLRLIDSRFRNGQVGRLEMARAESELAAVTAEALELKRLRDEREHALALLTGQAASNFQLAARPLAAEDEPPAVQPGLPSALLERRPDVAAAERRLMAANARIGVAEAAFFPRLSLTGSAGFGSNELDALFTSPNRSWLLGPLASLPILDGGRRQADKEQALAAHEERVALYRQQVLTAFKEVEDALSAGQLLAQQATARKEAAAAAREAAELSGKRYRAGRVSYLEVVESERTALAAERTVIQIQNQRLQAAISLVKALGGGW